MPDDGTEVRVNVRSDRLIWCCRILTVVLLHCCFSSALAVTNYVSLSGACIAPYGSWADAATNIQAAIDIAMPGDVVLVSNGVYNAGSVTPVSNMACRVVITNAITVQSVNGPAYTTIAGNAFPSSIRCAYVGTNAHLTGFTLVNGWTLLFDPDFNKTSGGGVMCDAGTVSGCLIMNNWAANGGGVMCNNGGILRNCLVVSNSCSALGGGVIINSSGTVQNCTIVTNNTSANGGGIYFKDGGLVENSIIWGNTASAIGANWDTSTNAITVRYTCTTPAVAGTNNITVNPLFTNQAASDFHLALGSPCINTGTNSGWMAGAIDLDGNIRIMNGKVDRGCFEYLYYGITATAGTNGTIGPTGTVYVAKGASTNYVMTPVANYHVADVLVDGGSVGASNTYAFSNVTTSHTIDVTFAINQFNLVVTNTQGTAVPAGVNTYNYDTTTFCSVVDSPFLDGTTTQYVCTGWAGSGSVPASGTQTNVTVTVTNDSSLTWQWRTNFWLDISPGLNGTVNVVSAWCQIGTNVTLTATPSGGHHFVNWTGDIASPVNPLVVSMTQPYAVTANFAINLYSISAIAEMNGSVAPSGTVPVAYGGTTNFDITPDPHYHVFNVLVDGVSVGPSNTYTFSNVATPHTLDAFFAIDTYTLAVTTPYGTAAPSGTTTNDYGTNLFCSVLNSPVTAGTTQYSCLGWTGTGSIPASGAGTNVSVTITNTSTMTWLWMTNYWLHSTAGPDGTVDKGDQWLGKDSTIMITATPAAKSYFAGWTGDVLPANTNDNPLTLTMDQARSVTANFVITTHYVSPSGSSVAPYTNWVTAATNIQDAINATVDGERVLVTDGVYRLTSQISMTNGIRLQSLNGPESTTLDGNDSVRCCYSGNSNNVLDGFTMTRGLADVGGAASLMGGTMRNCIVTGNTAGIGGGVYMFSNAVLRSCKISGNFAGWGGGVGLGDTGTVANCTVVSNTAVTAGGGIYSTVSATLLNDIVYFNTAPAGTNFSVSGLLSAACNCTWPAIAGSANITNNPQLTPLLWLRTTSPCIDAGTSTNTPVLDIHGKARWDHPGHANLVSIYDIGAEEFVDGSGNGMSDDWELQQLGGTNFAAAADNDGDGLSNLQEYNNSLCPTNPRTYYDSLNDNWKAAYGYTQPHTLAPLRGYECTRVGGYNTAGTAYGIDISSNYAYVADGANGLQVINISNPTNCTLTGGLVLAGTSYGVAVRGSYAYVAAGTNGLQLVDVSVPASCTRTGGLVTAGTAYGVDVRGSFAYVADGTNGLQVLNVSDPANCTLTGGYVTNGIAYGVCVSGNYAYVACGTNGLQIVDITVPASCSSAGSFVNSGDVRGVYVSNSLAYLTDLTNGLVVVDVSVPSSCVRTGGCYVYNGTNVAVAGGIAYVAGGWGLEVVDAGNPASCVHTGRCLMAEAANGLKVSSNFVYVVGSTNGLSVINVQPLDSDQDGLADSWEMQWFGNLGQTANVDFDVDTISNWGEYLIGSNPTSTDTDGDGLTDSVEINGRFTDPRLADTDGDGFPDGYEVAQGTDPRNAASFPASISGTIFYSGIQTGSVWIVVTNSVSSTNVTIGSPGGYSVTNRHTLTNHYVSAFRDMNGNGVHDAWEAFGSYSNNPVSLVNNTMGIDITLVDPQYNLIVSGSPSRQGAPLPYGYGTNLVTAGLVVTNSVVQHVVNGATQFICTGWTGTGSVPASGGTTNVNVMITNASSIAWNWAPELYYFTVASGPNGSAGGTSGWYAAGSSITNVVVPSNGYHFAGWTGNVPPANTNDTTLVLAVDQARSITANFTINMYTITPSVGPNGGIVPATAVQVPFGGSSTFTVNPSAHYHISDVSVDGSSVGVTNSWTFNNVTNAHTIHADFSIDMYNITASSDPNGSIAPPGVVAVPYGGGTNFVMTPNFSYYVKDVLVDGGSVGAVTGYTFSSISTTHTIAVSYDDKYALNVSTAHGTASPSGANMFKYGTNVYCALLDSPVLNGLTTQYVCSGWTGTGSVPASGAGTNLVVTVTNDSTLSWAWGTNYWLHAVTGSTNGSIDTGDGWHGDGSSVTITAVASNHYNFAGWSGTVSVTNNPLVLPMNQAHSVTANFAIVTYGITATSGGNGTISPSGVVQVPYDGSTNFTIAPIANYHISNVVVDAVSVGVTNGYTFLNVTNAHTIDALFAANQYDLTVTSLYGSPNPSGVNTYTWLTPLQCSVGGSPLVSGMTQYVCTGWTGTGSAPASGAGTNISFSLGTNSTVTWNWQTYYQMSAVAGSFGTVTATNGWLAAGLVTVVRANPATNYHFTGWTGDIVSTNNPMLVTMNRGYSLTANFAIDTFVITATSGANGSISPSGAVSVAYGASTNFTITPNAYHFVSNVVVDGVSIGVTNAYPFVNVTNAHTISVTFGVSSVNLTVNSLYGSPMPAAGVNVLGWGTVTNCMVSGSPVGNGATQYVCSGWTGSGSVTSNGVGTNVSVTVTNNSVLTWVWKTNYWLTTSTMTNGTIDVSSSWIQAGTNVTITATPLPGFWFSGWTGDVDVADLSKNPLPVTMTRPKAIGASFALSPYYVSPSGRHIWPFTSWINAATNIQAAVNVAGNGRLVLVTNGTYTVSTPVLVTNGITMQSINGSGSTIINGNSLSQCLYISHSNAVVTGFSITRGYAVNDGGGVMIANGGTLQNCSVSVNVAGRYGGGIYCLNSGLVVACTISGNISAYGGGVQCENGGLIAGCTMSGNTASFGGGGRLRNGGTMTNCTLNNNTALFSGGGVQMVDTGNVFNCTVLANVCSNYGGGIYCYLGGYVTNCTLSNNKANYGGGGLCENGGIIERSIVTGNSATYGGGVRCKQGGLVQFCVINNNTAYSGGGAEHVTNGILRNCSLSGNYATNSGGGVYCFYGGTVENCTMSGNTAGGGGGGLFAESGGTILNTIIYGNGSGTATNYLNSGSGMTYSYSCATPLLAGVGNIDADPLFLDASSGDFHLKPGSPCVDSGTNLAWMDTAVDLDGNSRIATFTVDMGVYEWPDSDGDGLANWNEINVYGTDPNNPDTDGDGMSDRAELIAGTNPLLRNDVFHMNDAAPAGGGGFVISWQSITGRLYTMQTKTNLMNSAWTNIPDCVDRPGIGGLMSWTNGSLLYPQDFYKVGVRLR